MVDINLQCYRTLAIMFLQTCFHNWHVHTHVPLQHWTLQIKFYVYGMFTGGHEVILGRNLVCLPVVQNVAFWQQDLDTRGFGR